MMHRDGIPGPVLEVDVARVRRNIRRMVAKANRSGAVLRPHFKTHQSDVVARWFRDEGVHCCTVSSPAMARYFADAGWQDILIALPCQPGALPLYQALSQKTRLGLVADCMAMLDVLAGGISTEIDFWIELDAGYGRTGVAWQDDGLLRQLAERAECCEMMRFRGLLCHAGESYACRGRGEVMAVYQRNVEKLDHARRVVEDSLGRRVELSFGDTPTCSICEDLSCFDELRPGNFVFYDLMQYQIGACDFDDMALALACPVIGVYPQRRQVVVHGGAVHFSKESMTDGGFGQVISRESGGVMQAVPGALLTGMSQEHGVISGESEWIASLRVGDIVRVLPVHSCLTMDAMRGVPSALRYVNPGQ